MPICHLHQRDHAYVICYGSFYPVCIRAANRGRTGLQSGQKTGAAQSSTVAMDDGVEMAMILYNFLFFLKITVNKKRWQPVKRRQKKYSDGAGQGAASGRAVKELPIGAGLVCNLAQSSSETMLIY